MINGLDALGKIRKCLFWSDEGLNDIAIIEKELKEWDYFGNELKKYHITKPFLKQFLDLLSICNSENGVNLAKFISENNVYDFQKKLKALEIIKRKIVLIDVFVESENVNDYNEFVSKSKDRHLTQKEYYLLKEALL